MQESKKRIVLIAVIGALVIGNAFFAFNYFFLYLDQQAITSEKNKTELNGQVLNFASMFVKKVLQADSEVDFETRLSLENAVRDLKDKEIMEEWQNFTGSKTEAEAQNSVKKLLEILISKIQR
ncbi:hypothetical protein A2356_00075 [Candidatus Nomurabacteria bacterium RIFOXYB1_FULL_39_16]|uniref:Uncharacterized protein n=2 Tax=Candidatus Nomuraibacteriota TaxID=1752729 RepID=A0A0G0QRD1_9BACT|nr:MAG: hypothetical protein UT78_C0010G0012 [Candidatus Nomurabacteria bacterium GW2011_GWF2_40_12]OGJ08811.1 MAG: hypothetical protein A2356_00075 [Candidatus Nomurabacteria bacterium RIFOXYB1_FULL_39_16]OGJ13992.1 MAG: hypothetical protein A2585_00810 [Candidatus Nomurabacteria bacterium RIFOXYD1_FULL_39_12]